MHFIVLTATLANSPATPHLTGFTRASWHSADYLQALTLCREQERQLGPGDFVVLAGVDGASDPQALDLAARTMTLRDDAVIRSAVGRTLAQEYAALAVPGVALTAVEFAELNAQKSLLLRLLDGQPLTLEQQLRLGGLTGFLDAVQDSASQQGVPDGVIWPDIPFGSAVEREASLWSERPDLAGPLLSSGADRPDRRQRRHPPRLGSPPDPHPGGLPAHSSLGRRGDQPTSTRGPPRPSGWTQHPRAPHSAACFLRPN